MEIKSVVGSFLPKLPASFLYEVDMGDRCYYNRDSGKDLFHFLANRDEVARCSVGGVRQEFHYIQWNQDSFKDFIFPLLKGAKTFIDVGCGGGDKLALVKKHKPRMKVYGVEHDPAMAAWASLFGDVVFCADAFTLDYKPFDVIYAYWPIADQKKMNQLAKHIVKTKLPRAKFVLVGFGSYLDPKLDGKVITEEALYV